MIRTSYKEAIYFCLISDQSVLHIVTNLLCVNPASSSVLGQRQDKVPVHIDNTNNNSTQHIKYSIKHVQMKPNTFKRKRYCIYARTFGANWQPCFCEYENCVPMVLQIGQFLLNDLAKLQNFRWCVFFGKYCHCFVIRTLRTQLYFFSFPPFSSSASSINQFKLPSSICDHRGGRDFPRSLRICDTSLPPQSHRLKQIGRRSVTVHYLTWINRI